MQKLNPSVIFSRITGISTPVLGLQWNAPVRNAEYARRIISFLEDRRVLYAPWNQEIVAFATGSIEEIRDRLTELLDECGNRPKLAKPLKTMRSACRDFLTATQEIQGYVVQEAVFQEKWDPAAKKYFVELSRLRTIFGISIADIVLEFHIEVAEELAAIIPNYDELK